MSKLKKYLKRVFWWFPAIGGITLWYFLFAPILLQVLIFCAMIIAICILWGKKAKIVKQERPRKIRRYE